MPVNDRQSGLVVKNDDPAKAGRVLVELQSMDGDVYPEYIEPILPAGMVSHAHPGDTVEVELPDGDDIVEFAHEVKYSGKRNTESTPVPDEFKINYPDRRGYKTPGGHLIIYDDKDKTITIRTIDGNSVVIDDVIKQIKLEVVAGLISLVASQVVMSASASIKLDSDTTELSSGADEKVIKGEAFNTLHETMLTLIQTAFTTLGTDPALSALTKTACGNAATGIQTFKDNNDTILSAKAKVG